ncbi:MAG: ferrous iron transport protein B [Gammaproteobacteria bacterium]|nr:ferrous iron transport protein B [Gammaproteobacteria bacterium]
MKACCHENHPIEKNKTITIALAGNPNSGKSTLFNALTGACQRVGNWPGVTVERQSGYFSLAGHCIEVIDLPGTYSLAFDDQHASLDEKIACDYLQSGDVDVIVNVLDAGNLERNLYLTVQLLEKNIPVILALNMMDIARKKGLQIDVAALEKKLGCPVVGLEASKKKGVEKLKEKMNTSLRDYEVFGRGNLVFKAGLPYPSASRARNDAFGIDSEILQADARYRFIETVLQTCVTKISPDRTWSSRIDNIILNRFLGIPIFLLMMYGLFFFAINIGGAFQDFFDIGSDTIFVGGLSQALLYLHVPTWLTALLANGIGKGINTTITFIPVIGAMFLFLSLLEDSGYMARAAFVVDRLMRAIGLPGKSFVPMIVGFGCNVPAVMATRTLENRRDRILTVMMSPFVSCGARLAIYAVFVAAFFPVGGQNIIFALYVIGIALAVFTGFLLRKTILNGEPAPLVMELPLYHLPNFKTVFRHTWQKLRGFVFRAGKLIIPICMVLGALNAINIDGSLNKGEGDTRSLLSETGRIVTPIFAPMGIQQDNWPATVGLVTGVLAKEVVIGTLNTLYSQAGHLPTTDEGFDFVGGLKEAVLSIPANFAALGSSLSNPVLAKAPVHTLSQSVYGEMFQRFHGQIAAFAYLLFILLYFPCVSTVAVMFREVGRHWAIFSVLWSTGVAYGVAVAFYQLATLNIHPFSSILWVCAVMSALFAAIFVVRRQHVFA